METKVFDDKYMERPMFTVWEVDENGHKVGERPKFSCGVVKAQFILKHENEIKEFVEKNGKQS